MVNLGMWLDLISKISILRLLGISNFNNTNVKPNDCTIQNPGFKTNSIDKISN